MNFINLMPAHLHNRGIEWEVDSITGCWNCTSHAQYEDGYVRTWVNGRNSRLSREIIKAKHPELLDVNGRLPSNIFARHLCDNPKCINPDHIVPGSHQDNMNDMIAHGRSSYGAINSTAVLDEITVRAIRENHINTNSELALQYNVFGSTIRRVRDRTHWVDVDNMLLGSLTIENNIPDQFFNLNWKSEF